MAPEGIQKGSEPINEAAVLGGGACNLEVGLDFLGSFLLEVVLVAIYSKCYKEDEALR